MSTDAKPTVALELVGVKKAYPLGELEVEVLHGIDLEILEGQITVILGHSGSGKTTLLNMMGALDVPTSGEIRFFGKDLAHLDDDALADYRRQNLGFVFQMYNLIPSLTARENVAVATEKVVAETMDPAEALGLVGLADKLDSFPSQLSGGEQQRVSIARAIARKPAILLCDEVTGALDSATGRKILENLVTLNEKLGSTIVFITHAMPIAQLAHRIIRIDSGRIIESRENDARARVEDIDW